MFQVRNKEVIRLLTGRQMKKNRQRNAIAIGAIILTSILFSALFTVSGGILEVARQSMMRASGSSAQAVIKFLSMPEYENVKAAGGYEKIGYSIVTGTGAHESLQKLYTEVRYGETYSAQSFRSFPTEGRMPEEKMEIAVPRLVLDAMGLPDRPGSRIVFPIMVDGTLREDTFTLCGVWDGDPVAPAQQVWVSKAYSEEIAPTRMTSFGEGMPYEGTVMADIDFSNTWNLQGKWADLIARAGLPEDTPGGINPAYSSLSVDLYTILTIVILLAVILVSGYLIIYNIFYISVTQDIQYYGLLKTIGASGKQLRRIVLRQAMGLSAVGIPAGLLAGYAVGYLLLPYVVMLFLQTYEFEDYTISPAVLAGAALFSLLTVYISFRSPGRIAASVSPVEAVRYTGETQQKGAPGRCRKSIWQCVEAHRSILWKRKAHIKMMRKKKTSTLGFGKSAKQKNAPAILALRNLRRDGKKAVLVILSLFLSMTLLNTTYTIISGFDLEQYVETQTNGDFEVTDWTVAMAGQYDKNLEGIDSGFEEAVSRLQGLTRFEKVYCELGQADLSEHALERLAWENEQGNEYTDMCDLERGQEPLYAYAATGTLVEHAVYTDGEFDAEKWAQGTYVVYCDGAPWWGVKPEMLYQPGDRITLEGKEGQKKEYTVMAVGELPSTLTARMDISIGINVILPEQEFAELYGKKQPLSVVYDVEKSHRDEAEKITAKWMEDSGMVCISFETLKEEFQKTKQVFTMIGGSLSLVLGAIGILNFINIMVTGILTRQKELAMLSAVGMGGRQMKRMLIWESAAYIGSASVLAVTAGNLLSWLICQDVVIRNQWAFAYHFTVVPVAVCLPLLLLAASAVPLMFYKKLCAGSVVERLRYC
ncbi:MAG: ABC transporter permease [Ruminococcus sp.]|jgi:putative ABC transport system permease protein|nr:ABC transporter permease [Ruminococcus sp.]